MYNLFVKTNIAGLFGHSYILDVELFCCIFQADKLAMLFDFFDMRQKITFLFECDHFSQELIIRLTMFFKICKGFPDLFSYGNSLVCNFSQYISLQ